MGIWFNIEKSVFVSGFELALSIYTRPQCLQVILCKLILYICCGSYWADNTELCISSAFWLTGQSSGLPQCKLRYRFWVWPQVALTYLTFLDYPLWHNEAETGSKRKDWAVQTEWKDTEGIRCARRGILRDFMYPGLTEDLWSTGRRAHSLTERTPARFDVEREQQSGNGGRSLHNSPSPHFT